MAAPLVPTTAEELATATRLLCDTRQALRDALAWLGRDTIGEGEIYAARRALVVATGCADNAQDRVQSARRVDQSSRSGVSQLRSTPAAGQTTVLASTG